MPIDIRCPGCDHAISVADQSQGKKLRCGRCQGVFVVRDGAAILAAPGTAPPPRTRAPRDNPLDAPPRDRAAVPAGKSGGGWVLPVLLGGGGVLVLACAGCVGLFVMLPSKAQGPQANVNKPAAQVPLPNPEPREQAPQKPPRLDPPANPRIPRDPPKPAEPKKDKDKEKPAVSWQVKPDPSAFQFKGEWDLKTEIPTTFQGKVIFPYLDSPFVALSDPKLRDQVQVYDLRTMKPVGVPLKAPFIGNFSLSPDGKYFASQTGGEAKVEVFTVEDGKLQQTFNLRAAGINLGLMDFPGNDLFVTETHEGPSDIRVWDLKTGKEVAKIDSPVEYFHWKWSSFTPGGKYLVMQETTGNGYTVYFWEIATGKPAGQFELQPKGDKWGQAQGVAFTPDGKLMSLVWRLNDNECWAKLWTWDVATGQKLSEHKIPKTPDSLMDRLCWHGTYRDLQWLPDGSGWMVTSHFVLDRETGKDVGRLGAVPSTIGGPTRKLLDANHMAIQVEKGPKRSFHVEAIPRDEIDAAMKKAREEKK